MEAAGVPLDKAGQRLGRLRFGCEADAQQARAAWAASPAATAWWEWTADILPDTRRRRRPGGGPLDTVTAWGGG